MNLRKAAVMVTTIVVLLAVGAAAWLWKAGGRLYSSPTMVRSDRDYENAHGPRTNVPPPTNFFDSVQIERTDTKIRLHMPGGSYFTPSAFVPAGEVQQADASQVVQLSEGSIRLEWIATGYSVPQTNFAYSVSVEGKFFGPDLKPLQKRLDEVSPYEKRLQFEGDFPASRFYFVCSNLPPCKALQFRAFDARTHFSLTRGYSSSGTSNWFWYGSALQLWHQTPVEILTTVALGPVVTYTIPAREGAQLQFPNGFLRVVALIEGQISGWGTENNGATNTTDLSLSPESDDERPQTTIAFFSWPNGMGLPVEFEVYGKDGKRLRSHGSGASERLTMMRVEARPDEVGEIKVNHYPNTHRLAFTLAELPGLPEVNRAVEDLFDVHIPYIRFRYEHDFQEIIANLVQMERDHLALNFPNGFFPLIRTNTTSRELFKVLDSLRTNQKAQLAVNSEKNRIEEGQNPIWAFINAVRKKLGN